MVTPAVNESPELRVEVLVTTPPELSVAVGTVQVTTAVLVPDAAVADALIGQLEMTGAVLSTTVPPGK